MNPTRSLRCFLFAGLFLATPLAWAQADSIPSTPMPATEAVADAIGIDTLIKQADEDEKLLQRVMQHADSPETYQRLSNALNAIAKTVDEKRRAFTEQELLRISVTRLESLALNWAFDARRLALWQTEMHDYSETYFNDTAELGKRLEALQSARTRLKADDLPEVLLARIDVLINQLKTTRNDIAAPLARQIELRQRASALDARIREGQRLTNAAITNIDRRLFSLDAQPLWAAPHQAAAVASAQASQDGLEIELRFAREYRSAALESDNLARWLQILLLPLIVWLAWLKRNQEVPTNATAPSGRVLNRPLSLYVLLSMAAILLIKSDAPLIVREGVLLIIMIPTLRLLPQSVWQLLKLWPFVISGLFVLSRVGYLFMQNVLLYRFFLLGLCLLTLAVIVWRVLRARQQDPGGQSLYSAIVRRTVWLCGLLLIIASISNVLGNVSLASMLLNGLASSSYAALVLTAFITSIKGLLSFTLRRKGMKRFRLVRIHGDNIFFSISRFATIAGVASWTLYTADSFRILRPFYAAVSDILIYRIEVGELSISLGDICVFIIAIFIAFWAARIVKTVLRDEMLPRLSLPRGVGSSVAALSYYAALMLGIMLALSAAGFKVGQLTLIFGALGVGIGFGLQNIVANLVSGLVLMLERPIQPGDTIEVANLSGKVTEINLRSTTLRTYDGAEVMLPNSILLAGSLTNWTMFDRKRRFEVPVGVTYDADPRQVLAILAQCTQATPGILPDPEPAVIFQGFGDSAMNFAIRAWAEDYDGYLAVRSELLTHVHTALTEAGISIPFPQRDLHLRSISEAASEALKQTKPADDGAQSSSPA